MVYPLPLQTVTQTSTNPAVHGRESYSRCWSQVRRPNHYTTKPPSVGRRWHRAQLRCFKSGRDEICQADLSNLPKFMQIRIDWGCQIFHLTSNFQDGGHARRTHSSVRKLHSYLLSKATMLYLIVFCGSICHESMYGKRNGVGFVFLSILFHSVTLCYLHFLIFLHTSSSAPGE